VRASAANCSEQILYIKRTVRTGPKRPVRIFSAIRTVASAFVLAAAFLITPAAAAAPIAPAAAVAPAQASKALGQGINDFYRGRVEPLWFGKPGRQVQLLMQLLGSAELDGLPGRYRVDVLRQALQAASSGDRKAVGRADTMLSEAFVDYVHALRTPAGTGTIYVDKELKPKPPTDRAILEGTLKAPSLENYVAEMRWMNPMYAQLRRALASGAYGEQQKRLIRVNMDRVRELPNGDGRYILVNAAAQRLFMYENGRPVDSMRVVVGKTKYPTPMMSALVRFAALNPYWYVPADLTAERIAPMVVKQGMKYLDRQGYQVVSSFDEENPQIIDPKTVNWQAVADGKQQILIRQLPGPYNSMGRIKFMFPNVAGVYLHDNPERELFEQAARLYSGGCVRLEAAWRLSRWIFGKDLTWEGAGTEEKVRLDYRLPVYITYLTAVPDGSSVAFLDDVYNRDSTRVAASAGADVASAH
jgi:murein L,D-transpeptidase YcbB/YkuD